MSPPETDKSGDSSDEKSPLLAKPHAVAATKSWDRIAGDEKVRLRINGETEQQMKHVRAVKAARGVALDGRSDDTSKDAEWPIEAAWSSADKYVYYTTVLSLGPKIIILAIPMLLTNGLPCLACRLYITKFVGDNEVMRVERTAGFYAFCWLLLPFSLPALLLVLLSYLYDCIFIWFWSVLYCLCTWRWTAAVESFKAIRPYRGGPSIWFCGVDLIVTVMGQLTRQGFGEVFYMLSCMWLVMPFLKYHINCNPWVYDLGERLCQQISTPMDDLGSPSEVAEACRRVISKTKQKKKLAERIDLWQFVPHYPQPPPGRRWALGLQAGGIYYPGKFHLFVHVTHAAAEAEGITEQFVLSNCVEEPVYRVMLWYNNPYHFLTGWVEASVSNGEPSQPEKRGGGEHPMWLITPKYSPMVAGRGGTEGKEEEEEEEQQLWQEGFTGSGMIDKFFDKWLPIFVHEMRNMVFCDKLKAVDREACRGFEEVMGYSFTDPAKCDDEALNYANKLYQEVYSNDGISRIRTKRGLEQYGGDSELSRVYSAANHQSKQLQHQKAEAAYTGRGSMQDNLAHGAGATESKDTDMP